MPDSLPNRKLLSLEHAVRLRGKYRDRQKKVVLTNGCFDLLHTGHLYFLQRAAALGDALFVALNSDASVRSLKGPSRPVQNEQERAYHLAALRCVRAVLIFDTPRLDAEITALQPDCYAKAGDYQLETLNPLERTALEASGSRIEFLPFLQGYSTTSLIKKIRIAAETF